MKTNANATETKSLRVNENREAWDAIYSEIRKLCIIRGTRIRKYLGIKTKSTSTTFYNKGKLQVRPTFWNQLKPAHKSQISIINNKIEDLQKQLLAC